MNIIDNFSEWILIAPSAYLAIARRPLLHIPDGTRIASCHELLAANRGCPFPWGNLPQPHPDNRQWRKHKVGTGGLVHTSWFLTSEGRYGGAPNVPETVPGSLRRCFYLDGGNTTKEQALAENEGYAIVKRTSEGDRILYRKVQLFAATHVMADGGSIIMSPIGPNARVMVGFVGRCQVCPNAELISFQQLKAAVPEYDFCLWPEWTNWSIGPRSGDLV